MPALGSPDCPDWLDKYAQSAWDQIAPQLETLGVLTKIDGHALALLCQTWAKWQRAEEMIQKHGEVYPIKTDAGEVKYLQQSPYVAIARSSGEQLTRLFREFGLTPSSRTRIQVDMATDAKTDKDKRINAG
jgi:P27 family predicted phage terminase small subunit